MRVPGVRVRTLMLAIAVGAVLFSGVREWASQKQAAVRYRGLAANHYFAMIYHVQRAEGLRRRLDSGALSAADSAETEHTLAAMDTRREATVRLVSIYEHMASHPWESSGWWPFNASVPAGETARLRRLLSQPFEAAPPATSAD